MTVRNFSRNIGGVALAALISGSATAGIVIPDLSIEVAVNGAAVGNYHPGGTSTGGTTFNYTGLYAETGYELGFDIDVDTDPVVNAFLAFQNQTNQTNIYTLTVTLPTGPIAGPTTLIGSVGGSVTDGNGTGVPFAQVAALAFSQIYIGQIDGADVPITALLPFPYTATVLAPFQTAAIGPAGFSGLIGPGVASSIGIQLEFSLTPGDSVAITSVFSVEPIPAPGALALLGVAGLVGSGRRRR